MLDALRQGYRKLGTTRGRATRPEFWWFHLYAVLVALGCGQVTRMLWSRAFDGQVTPGEQAVTNPDAIVWSWYLAAIAVMVAFAIGVALPALTMGARRLHDAGMSAMWMVLVPLGLGIVPLLMCLRPSTPGSNRHGPHPRVTAVSR